MMECPDSSEEGTSMSPEWTLVIGRLGRIHGLISKSELNESIGRVTGYVVDKKRYVVKCNDGILVSIKVENITFIDDSDDEYGQLSESSELYMQEVDESALEKQSISAGAVVQLGDGSCLKYPELTINQHCLIRGNDNCVFKNMLLVDVKSDVRVEFENIKFFTKFPNAVIVSGGSTAIFRNCTFTSDDACFASDSDSVVYLENCTFEKARGSGNICAGVQFMRNCTIRDVGGFGIEVRDQGRLKAMQSRIVGTRMAGVCGYKNGESIELHTCDISRSGDSGVLIAEGCTGNIQNCNIKDVRVAGVAVEQKGTASIDGCNIMLCLQGVLAQTGKCKVRVSSCHIERCKTHGIFVAVDCIGRVDIADNSFKKIKMKDINNDSSDDHCMVTLNGSKLSSRHGIRAQISPSVCSKIEEATTAIYSPSFNEAQATLKARARVGLARIVCGGCGNEQGKVKFLTCSRCLDTRYCSKQCQKEHWKSGHKESCVKRIKHSALLNPNMAI